MNIKKVQLEVRLNLWHKFTSSKHVCLPSVSRSLLVFFFVSAPASCMRQETVGAWVNQETLIP